MSDPSPVAILTFLSLPIQILILYGLSQTFRDRIDNLLGLNRNQKPNQENLDEVHKMYQKTLDQSRNGIDPENPRYLL